MSIFRFKQRRGTTTNCQACTDIPLDGEVIIEKCDGTNGTTNGNVRMKIGDGSSTFSSLSYIAGTDYIEKLNTIDEGANNYILPVAGTSIGGIKSGTDITVDVDGNVSVSMEEYTDTEIEGFWDEVFNTTA